MKKSIAMGGILALLGGGVLSHVAQAVGKGKGKAAQAPSALLRQEKYNPINFLNSLATCVFDSNDQEKQRSQFAGLMSKPEVWRGALNGALVAEIIAVDDASQGLLQGLMQVDRLKAFTEDGAVNEKFRNEILKIAFSTQDEETREALLRIACLQAWGWHGGEGGFEVIKDLVFSSRFLEEAGGYLELFVKCFHKPSAPEGGAQMNLEGETSPDQFKGKSFRDVLGDALGSCFMTDLDTGPVKPDHAPTLKAVLFLYAHDSELAQKAIQVRCHYDPVGFLNQVAHFEAKRSSDQVAKAWPAFEKEFMLYWEKNIYFNHACFKSLQSNLQALATKSYVYLQENKSLLTHKDTIASLVYRAIWGEIQSAGRKDNNEFVRLLNWHAGMSGGLPERDNIKECLDPSVQDPADSLAKGVAALPDVNVSDAAAKEFLEQMQVEGTLWDCLGLSLSTAWGSEPWNHITPEFAKVIDAELTQKYPECCEKVHSFFVSQGLIKSDDEPDLFKEIYLKNPGFALLKKSSESQVEGGTRVAFQNPVGLLNELGALCAHEGSGGASIGGVPIHSDSGVWQKLMQNIMSFGGKVAPTDDALRFVSWVKGSQEGWDTKEVAQRLVELRIVAPKKEDSVEGDQDNNLYKLLNWGAGMGVAVNGFLDEGTVREFISALGQDTQNGSESTLKKIKQLPEGNKSKKKKGRNGSVLRSGSVSSGEGDGKSPLDTALRKFRLTLERNGPLETFHPQFAQAIVQEAEGLMDPLEGLEPVKDRLRREGLIDSEEQDRPEEQGESTGKGGKESSRKRRVRFFTSKSPGRSASSASAWSKTSDDSHGSY